MKFNKVIKQFPKINILGFISNPIVLKIGESIKNLEKKTNKKFAYDYFNIIKKLAYTQTRPNSEFILEKLKLEIKNF